MLDPTSGRDAHRERTAADLSSLLVEMSRALKALRYYAADHPSHRDAIDRAYLAWRVELDRLGAVELEVDDDGFRAVGIVGSVPDTHLKELADALFEHGVSRLRFDPELDRPSYQRLIELLLEEERVLAEDGGLAAALSRHPSAGIRLLPPSSCQDHEASFATVNEDPDETTQPMVSVTMPEAADVVRPVGDPTDAPEPVDEERIAAALDSFAGQGPPLEVDPDARASLGSALLGSDAAPTVGMSPDDETAPDLDPMLDEPASVTSTIADEEPTPAFEDFTKPSLEEDPLGAPAVSDVDETLRTRLIELDRSEDDRGYTVAATDVVAAATLAAHSGHRDAAYRAILVFADHAVSAGQRPASQAALAREQLEEVCSGPQLEEVIDRACDPEGRVSVRAAQVLLQLGGRAIGPLLDRLVSEHDPDHIAQITAIALALGERATPILVSAIRGEDARRARVAVRIAGEIQSSRMVPTLVAVVEGATPELRREALRALARVGGERAVEAIEAALESTRPGVAETAAASLAEMRSRGSVRRMLDRLDAAVAAAESEMARSLIKSLGRLGAPEAVPKLVALLERRTILKRALTRGLRLPALEALAILPGREALRAVERAARHRDERVRQAAQRALARHAENGAGNESAGR